MKSETKRSLALIIVFVSISAVPAFMVSRIIGTEAVQRWVRTPCSILHSSTDSYTAKTGKLCNFVVKYSYTYEGRNYFSNRYSMSGSPTVCHQVRKLTKKFHLGTPATCFVNPNTPSEAVLDRRRSPMAFV